MAEFSRLPTQEELSRMLYQMQLGNRSQQDIINENLSKGSNVKPIPDNIFQKMAGGAQTAKEQVNKLGNMSDIAKLFPGYTGQSQISIPTDYNLAPKQDVYGGLTQQGMQTQKVNIDQLLKAIKPADVLGLTGAQQAYSDVGMGKAPKPMDVLDIAGLGIAGLGAGKGLLEVAKATKNLPVGMSIKDVSSPFSIAKRDASDVFGAGAERIRYTEPKSGASIDVLVKPNSPASVMSLEVPEAFRGKKIGESLQAKVLQDFPEMQGQVSSKAAAKTAYRLGRRPVNDPNASIDDVFKMIDENSSVNMVSPQMQNKVSGLLGSPESSIKDVTDLSYKGSHAAPNAKVYGATIDNLEGIMPKDVYSSKGANLYGIGNRKIDSEWFSAAYKAKGNPDADVTIYRSVPKGVKTINNGDWVTTSKTYAKDHGENTLNGDYEIIEKKVKAKTLSSEGYPYEFGYNE